MAQQRLLRWRGICSVFCDCRLLLYWRCRPLFALRSAATATADALLLWPAEEKHGLGTPAGGVLLASPPPNGLLVGGAAARSMVACLERES